MIDCCYWMKTNSNLMSVMKKTKNYYWMMTNYWNWMKHNLNCLRMIYYLN